MLSISRKGFSGFAAASLFQARHKCVGILPPNRGGNYCWRMRLLRRPDSQRPGRVSRQLRAIKGYSELLGAIRGYLGLLGPYFAGVFSRALYWCAMTVLSDLRLRYMRPFRSCMGLLPGDSISISLGGPSDDQDFHTALVSGLFVYKHIGCVYKLCHCYVYIHTGAHNFFWSVGLVLIRASFFLFRLLSKLCKKTGSF